MYNLSLILLKEWLIKILASGQFVMRVPMRKQKAITLLKDVICLLCLTSIYSLLLRYSISNNGIITVNNDLKARPYILFQSMQEFLLTPVFLC
jgi:hypothetical protein